MGISLTIKESIPKRGDVWLINLEPTLGVEIKKIRPVVVINSDAIGKLPLKLIAPITDWKSYFAQNPWHVKIKPNQVNGLSKVSAVDTLQLRGVDRQRFLKKLGVLSPQQMKIINIAILTVIEADLRDF